MRMIKVEEPQENLKDSFRGQRLTSARVSKLASNQQRELGIQMDQLNQKFTEIGNQLVEPYLQSFTYIFTRLPCYGKSLQTSTS